MKCPNCGHEVPDGDAFCSKCGTRLSEAENDEATSDAGASKQRYLLHGRDGKRYGPYSAAAVQKHVEAGKIPRKARVTDTSTDETQSVGAVLASLGGERRSRQASQAGPPADPETPERRENDTKSPQVLGHEARQLLEQGQLDRAALVADKALSMDADDPLNQYLRGAIAFEKEDYRRAITCAETALRLRPEYPKASELLSNVRAQLEKQRRSRMSRLQSLPQTKALLHALSLKEKASALVEDSPSQQVADGAARALKHAEQTIGAIHQELDKQIASERYALDVAEEQVTQSKQAVRTGDSSARGVLRRVERQRERLVRLVDDLEYLRTAETSEDLGGFVDVPLDTKIDEIRVNPASGLPGPEFGLPGEYTWVEGTGVGAGVLLAIAVFLPFIQMDLGGNIKLTAAVIDMTSEWPMILLLALSGAFIAVWNRGIQRVCVHALIGLYPVAMMIYVVFMIVTGMVRGEPSASATYSQPSMLPPSYHRIPGAEEFAGQIRGLERRMNEEIREAKREMQRRVIKALIRSPGAWLFVVCPVAFLLLALKETDLLKDTTPPRQLLKAWGVAAALITIILIIQHSGLQRTGLLTLFWG
ncbi:MAG: zinc-ribbon domain-containing protein [Armatimonadota bacterium]